MHTDRRKLISYDAKVICGGQLGFVGFAARQQPPHIDPPVAQYNFGNFSLTRTGLHQLRNHSGRRGKGEDAFMMGRWQGE